ncbi:translation initiation factor IF-2 subunit beta [Candidatus Pacearchaeota archaeon]|nr:translation initiation factor IF-2 subunit beta [Candidatus Pacearchaeota archaeon]|tara:strand:- start:881 stop:1282 length:402 start_codon:yes stop_codon:yes gene_type:complete
MEYEELLEEAYENVQPCKECDRFEIKGVEGHHQGSKTVISNFVQVAGCLRREGCHLAKFLFKSLATSGDIDGDRLILDRKISSKDINEKVEKYVKQFVLCSSCKKPDTELVEENSKMFIRCLACGTKKPVHKV